MGRFSTQSVINPQAQQEEELKRRQREAQAVPSTLKVGDPDSAALDAANVAPRLTPTPSTDIVNDPSPDILQAAGVAQRVKAPEVTPDPMAQQPSESSPEGKKFPNTGLDYHYEDDPRFPTPSPLMKGTLMDMEAQRAKMEEARNLPVSGMRKFAGVMAGLGVGMLGGNPIGGYKLVADAEKRKMFDPAKRALETDQARMDTMKDTVPLENTALNAESQRANIQHQAQGMPRKVGQYTGEDGKVHFVYADPSDPTGRTTFELDSDGNVRPSPKRGVFGTTITVGDAIQAGMTTVPGPNKTMIDLTTLSPELQVTELNDGTFAVGSQTQTTVTAGNQVTRMGRFENKPSQAVPLGPSRTPTDTMRTAPIGTDAQGHTITAQLPGRNAPVTTGLLPDPGAPPTQQGPAPQAAPMGPVPQMQNGVPAAAPAAPAPQPTARFSTQRPPAAPAAPKAAAAPQGNGTKTWSGVYASGQAKIYQDKAAPIRTGLTSLINDPEHKTPDALMDFDYLADVAGSRARLGTFDTLLLDGLANSGSGQGEVSVGAGGVGVGTGKLGAYLSNKLGVPALAAGAQAQAIEGAYSALKPEEQRYVNALVDALETAPGFRKVTGAGVYEYSIVALQRSLPIFGKTGVTNSKVYNDKLMRLVQQNLVGTEQIPDEFLPKAYYQQKLQELAAKSGAPGTGQRGAAPGGAPGGGGGGGKTASRANVQAYADANKVDYATAEKQFKNKGYTVK